MLLVLVLEPLDAWDGVLVDSRVGGCVEACYGGRDVEGGDYVVYICVWVMACSC